MTMGGMDDQQYSSGNENEYDENMYNNISAGASGIIEQDQVPPVDAFDQQQHDQMMAKQLLDAQKKHEKDMQRNLYENEDEIIDIN